MISGIFLPEVAMAFFGSSDPAFIAITSQIVTVAMVASVIFGILLGILTVKFDHKKLLVLGVLCISFGALGCSLAPNFVFLQIFYAIEGIGTTVAGVMVMVLVGERLALNKRPQATGWIISGSSISGIVGTLVVSFFFNTGNWRSFLMWFALPVSLIALAAAYFGVPSTTQKQTKTVGKGAYLSAFKKVFQNKSATACLIGNMIRVASMMWAIYYQTFFRTEFGLPIDSAALIGTGFVIVLGLGHLTGGYLVNRTGRKRLTVISLVIHGAALPLIVLVPDLLVALASMYAGSFIGSFAYPSMLNLTLEQAPESRGTLMSVNNVLSSVGGGIGGAVGGISLTLFNYTGVFFAFAALILIAAAIYFFLTKDPCISKKPDSPKPELA
jgi:predicted MFS family arabinose efflux permease